MTKGIMGSTNFFFLYGWAIFPLRVWYGIKGRQNNLLSNYTSTTYHLLPINYQLLKY